MAVKILTNKNSYLLNIINVEDFLQIFCGLKNLVKFLKQRILYSGSCALRQ